VGFALGGGRRGILSDVNIVPLIDILLVLLVIFMIIPHHQQGLDASIPQQSKPEIEGPPPSVVVVQVLADGSLRINQEPVTGESLEERLEHIFALGASRAAFVRGDSPVEFAAVVRIIDTMRTAGVTSIGLLTPELEKDR
jgi:biopolymer transport protein ExbD/biopolymer transport protein TolR